MDLIMFAKIETDNPMAYQAMIVSEATNSAILVEWQEDHWTPICGYRDFVVSSNIRTGVGREAVALPDCYELPELFIEELEHLYDL